MTVVVPLQLLGGMRADRFEWLVPGLREELVVALIRGLPKELRRPLVPVPETAARVLARLEPRRRPLAEDMSRAITAVSIPPGAWDFSRLPPHLRMTFRVVDAKRGVLATGKDLAQVRAQVRPLLRAELTAASSKLERTGLTAWEIGSLPREVTLRGTGQAVRAYPALVDEGSTVGVKVLETAGRPGRRHVGAAPGGCCCCRPRRPRSTCTTASPTPTGSRCRPRRTAASRRCSTTPWWPPPTR